MARADRRRPLREARASSAALVPQAADSRSSKTRCSSRSCARTRSGCSCCSRSSSPAASSSSASARARRARRPAAGQLGNLFGSAAAIPRRSRRTRSGSRRTRRTTRRTRTWPRLRRPTERSTTAIATLEQLKAVNPKDVDGLTQLASLYLRKARPGAPRGRERSGRHPGRRRRRRHSRRPRIHRSGRPSRALGDPSRLAVSEPARARSSRTPTRR